MELVNNLKIKRTLIEPTLVGGVCRFQKVKNNHSPSRNFSFRGQYHRLRNRWYSPQLGRFVSRDPIRFGAGDVNLYRFVGNYPITSLDPMGLDNQTIDGYVNATSFVHASFGAPTKKSGKKNFSICGKDDKSVNSTLLTYSIQLSLSTTIDYYEDQNGESPNLTKHEQKHVDIYNELGNSSWKIDFSIDKCPEDPSECEAIKNASWVALQNKLLGLINAQNAWDSQDANNISKERINVGRSIDDVKQEFDKEFKCEKE